MLRVQRIPRGLLSQLDSHGERNPDQFDSVIRGTVDLAPFYLADRIEAAQATSAVVNTVGSFAQLDIPAGQVWRVLAVSSAYSVFSAGATIRAATQIIPPGASFGVSIAVEQVTVAAVGDEAYVTTFLPQNVLLPPGTRIQTRNTQATVATYTIATSVLFQRLTA